MPLVPLQADILGPDFRVETISLPPDPEGPVVATLVTLAPERPNGRAVLHVHGFADYFFHTEYARWWADRGYAFYALDLHKCGRSRRHGATIASTIAHCSSTSSARVKSVASPSMQSRIRRS